MRHPLACLVCLMLCACAALPEKPVDLVAPVIVAKLTLRDLRRADRALATRDAALGAPVPLKLQPAETVQLHAALTERLGLTSASPAAVADLNDFDLYRKPDGTLTVVINLILRRDGRTTMHRINRSLPPGAPEAEKTLVQQAIRDLMATITTSGNKSESLPAKPQTP